MSILPLRRIVGLLILAVPALTVVSGCDKNESPAQASPKIDPILHEKLVKLFGGAENLQLISQAKDVRATRVLRSPIAGSERKVLAGPVPLDESQRTKLAAWLTDPKSYGWDLAKGCAPSPGLELEFHHEKRTLVISVCLVCNMVDIAIDGKTVGGEDCDAIGAKLLDLARELFPDDKVLRDFKPGVDVPQI